MILKQAVILFLIFSVHHEASPVSPHLALWSPLLNLTSATFTRAFLPDYIDLTREVLQNSAVSPSCRQSLRQALEGLQARETASVALFNSWAAFPPAGIVSGTLTDFGDYDQCLNIDHVPGRLTGSFPGKFPERFRSQYCLLDLSLPMPRPLPPGHNLHHRARVLPETGPKLAENSLYRHLASVSSIFYFASLQMGVCLPESCTKADIELVTAQSKLTFFLIW